MDKLLPVVSGGFDPLHSGHINYIYQARKIFKSPVIVLLNSDEWLIRKKGAYFMPYTERMTVLASLKPVMGVYRFNDDDNTCIDGLALLNGMFSNRLVFCKGGDRTADNTPEQDFCKMMGIHMQFGVGGGKTQASSDLLKDYLERIKCLQK